MQRSTINHWVEIRKSCERGRGRTVGTRGSKVTIVKNTESNDLGFWGLMEIELDSFYGTDLGPLHMCHSCVALTFVVLLAEGVRADSDFLACS